MKVQANVLSRQHRRVFLDMISNAQVAQAYIQRHKAMKWFQDLQQHRQGLQQSVD